MLFKQETLVTLMGDKKLRKSKVLAYLPAGRETEGEVFSVLILGFK